MLRTKVSILICAALLAAVSVAQESPAPESPPKPPEPAPPGELPPLPEPAPAPDDDLLRNTPGSRLKPAPEGAPSLLPGSNRITPGERPQGRSTLRAPQTSADLDARIRFRQAHTKALQDPKILAIWDESRKAKTDYERREALKRYFTALYKKILSFDKGIAPMVAERQQYSLRRLMQTRIDPTDPIDAHNRVELSE